MSRMILFVQLCLERSNSRRIQELQEELNSLKEQYDTRLHEKDKTISNYEDIILKQKTEIDDLKNTINGTIVYRSEQPPWP